MLLGNQAKVFFPRVSLSTLLEESIQLHLDFSRLRSQQVPVFVQIVTHLLELSVEEGVLDCNRSECRVGVPLDSHLEVVLSCVVVEMVNRATKRHPEGFAKDCRGPYRTVIDVLFHLAVVGIACALRVVHKGLHVDPVGDENVGCLSVQVLLVLPSSVLEETSNTNLTIFFSLGVARLKLLLVRPVVNEIYVSAEASFDKFSFFLWSLKLDEMHVIDRTAFREKVFLQPLEDAIVDFDLVDAQFSSDLSRCFQRSQQWRTFDYDVRIAATAKIVAQVFPSNRGLRNAKMRQRAVMLILYPRPLLF